MFLSLNAKPAGHGGLGIKKAAPRFQGQPERDAFKARLREFPEDSLARLAEIKREEVAEAPKHVKHVKLAVAYGQKDTHIHWMNQTILSLMKIRNGQRTSDPAASETAQAHLGDLREAMNAVFEERGFSSEGQKLDQTA